MTHNHNQTHFDNSTRKGGGWRGQKLTSSVYSRVGGLLAISLHLLLVLVQRINCLGILLIRKHRRSRRNKVCSIGYARCFYTHLVNPRHLSESLRPLHVVLPKSLILRVFGDSAQFWLFQLKICDFVRCLTAHRGRPPNSPLLH